MVLQKTLLIVNPRQLEWVLNLKTVNCQNIVVVVVLSQEVNSPPCQKMCDKILMRKKYRAHTLGFFSVKKICWQHPFGFSVFRAHKNI